MMDIYLEFILTLSLVFYTLCFIVLGLGVLLYIFILFIIFIIMFTLFFSHVHSLFVVLHNFKVGQDATWAFYPLISIIPHATEFVQT